MLQALGGAMLNPVAMSIIVNTFTEPEARARAIGIWGAVVGISMALGPLLGGILTQTIGWRSIFWINLPIGATALFLTARFVPESRAEKSRRIDPVAQRLIVVALAALTSSIIDGRRVGWSSPVIVLGLVTTALSIVGLIAYESRRDEPLLDLRFFRSAPFAAATMIAVLSFAAFSGFLFLNSLYLQEARGLSASGGRPLCTLPVALALVVCSPLSGSPRRPGPRARLALVAAGVAIAAGAAPLDGSPSRDPAPAVDRRVRRLRWRRARHGGTRPSRTRPSLRACSRSAGWARGRRRFGRADRSARRFGVALAGSLAGAGISAAHGPGFAESTRAFFWVVVVYGAVIVFLGLASTGPRARASAARVAFLPRHLRARKAERP